MPCNCPNPTNVQNAVYQPSFGPYSCNSVVTYTCNQGYRISGISTQTCVSPGRWSGALPSCQQEVGMWLAFLCLCVVGKWILKVTKSRLVTWSHLKPTPSDRKLSLLSSLSCRMNGLLSLVICESFYFNFSGFFLPRPRSGTERATQANHVLSSNFGELLVRCRVPAERNVNHGLHSKRTVEQRKTNLYEAK